MSLEVLAEKGCSSDAAVRRSASRPPVWRACLLIALSTGLTDIGNNAIANLQALDVLANGGKLADHFVARNHRELWEPYERLQSAEECRTYLR